MTINKELNNKELVLHVEGEINSTTAPELEAAVKDSLRNINKLIFDFTKLDYLSSAGLRVLLVAKKVMDKQGAMIIRGANESVMEVFSLTGFASVLDFED